MEFMSPTNILQIHLQKDQFSQSTCWTVGEDLRHQKGEERSPGIWVQFSSVQLISRVLLFVTPWTVVCQASLPSPTPRISVQLSSVQTFSHVRLFVIPWIIARQDSLSISNYRSLLKLMPVKSVMPSSHLILCHPLLILPPIPPSIRVFSNESTLHMKWPKYWSFSFSISPSNEHPGLISFRMDWLDLLAVQGTLKSLLQHHSSKASIFLVLCFLYSPTLTSIHDHWKIHSLDHMDLCWQSNVSAF